MVVAMISRAVTATAERIPAHYLDQISRYPMLSVEEEQALAHRWRDQQDPALPMAPEEVLDSGDVTNY